jgi:hypothetical protein
VWCLPARVEPPARIVCQTETRSGELIDQDDVSLSRTDGWMYRPTLCVGSAGRVASNQRVPQAGQTK